VWAGEMEKGISIRAAGGAQPQFQGFPPIFSDSHSGESLNYAIFYFSAN